MNVQELVEQAPGPVVVLDSQGRVVATNVPDGERADALVLYVADLQELRSGFTAAVSHELRTPLARLLVLLESASLPDADVEGLLEQARREVEATRELVDDVLFLGELETGREVVSLGSTPARPVVDEVVAALAERAQAADVTLVVRGPRDLDLPLRPRMLRVVVENLVENSIRYAGPGATCAIELGRGLLRVGDDGAGVSDADLPRLFERFYRADAARTTRGTGLGLAIVKHIVTSAGGTVEARRAGGLEVACRFPV